MGIGRRGRACVRACVFGGVVLPRIVMVLLELRLVSQSSSHEGRNANTSEPEDPPGRPDSGAPASPYWPGWTRVCAESIPERAQEAGAGSARRAGGAVAARGSCDGVSPDICALTSTGGFHCFCGRGGFSRRPRLDRSTRRPSHFLLLATTTNPPPPPPPHTCVPGSSKVSTCLLFKRAQR